MGSTQIKEDGDFLWGTAERGGREKDVEVGWQTKDFRVMSYFKEVAAADKDRGIDFDRHASDKVTENCV